MDDIFSIYSENYGKNINVKHANIYVTYDTSVLLDLYRLSPTTREEVLELYSKIGVKFGHFIAHHVALEFSKNKDKVKNDSDEKLTDIRGKFKSFKKSLIGVSKVGGFSTPIHDLAETLNPKLQEIEQVLSRNIENHFKVDDLYEDISSLFIGKVSEPFSEVELLDIMREGDARFASGISPGFKDSSKIDFLNFYGLPIDAKYGDLIIWKQLIEFSKKNKSDLIFISSDQKGDWKERGRIRSDLALEFRNKTGSCIYMFTPAEFSKKFKRELEQELSESTSNELADIESQYDNWLDEVINAFEGLGGTVKLSDVYSYIESNTSRILPTTWDSTIRRTIYNHSSDVNAYLGKKDLFERVGSGEWKLRSKN